MDVTAAILSALLATALAYSAVRKLSHDQEVVASYARAGVPESRLDLLAAVLLIAAGGLLAGIAAAPLGALTAACLVVYFGVAIGFHARAGDLEHATTPATLALIAAAALAFNLAAI